MVNRVGQHFGDYRLTGYLGGGGFADVYLGEHIYLGTKAAVKVLKGEFPKQEIAKFRTEAQTIVGLEHRQIIRVLTFSVAKIDQEDIPFLVMDHAPHGSLDKRHPRGSTLPLETVVSYVKQIAAALQYAHDHNVVHRDIKPANFLLGKNEEILLSDFGIAVMTHRTSSWREQNIAGSKAYMAPEQFRAKAQPASDQYSLGITVYQWLCGELPFTEGDMGYHHNFTSPAFLREKGPTISPPVEDVVLKALAKDPKKRFESVQAFAHDLEQVCQTAGQLRSSAPLSQSSSIQPSMNAPSHRSSPPRDLILPPKQPSVPSHIVAEPNQSLVPVPPTTAPSQAPISSLTAPLSGRPPVTSSSQTVHPLPAANPSRQPPSSPISPPSSQPTITSRRRGLSRSKTGMLIGLVFMLVIGSGGLLSAPVNNSITATHATATANAYASATTNAQATANVYVRATANAQATVTAAVSAYNTASATGVMFGFDPQHTHFNPYEKVLNPANVSHLIQYWTATTGAIIDTSPAVANGVVYVVSLDHKLYAFTATTGKLLWTATTGAIIDTSPAVANGVVYVGSFDYKLYAFNASTGKPLWTATTGNAIGSSPAVANGVVYVGSDDYNLYAFTATTGKLLWTTTTGDSIFSSPAVANGVVYVGSNDHKLYAFTATTSAIIFSSPAVANGVVYVGSWDHKLYAFHLLGATP